MDLLASTASLLRPRPQPPESSVTLRALSFMATVIYLFALAWLGGDVTLAVILLAVTASGHVFSWYRRENQSRLVRLLIPLAILLLFIPAWEDFTALFSGGPLLPMARFLAMAQAISSFGLRTRRNLYDSLALSLAILLMMGERALSLAFLGLLLPFAVVALIFMATCYVTSAGERAERIGFPKIGLTLGLGATATVVTLIVAVVLFLVLPQNHAVAYAGPLPSRLDLTAGWPPPPGGAPEGDWAPWARFLPSRDLEVDLGSGDGRGLAGSERAQYVDLGYTGDRTGDVVLYVRSNLASFWRGFTLDSYDGHGWVASGQAVRLHIDQLGRLRFLEAPSRLPRGETFISSPISFGLISPMPCSPPTRPAGSHWGAAGPAAAWKPSGPTWSTCARPPATGSYRRCLA